MKFAKIIALILALSTLCCMFIACEEGEDVEIDLPERDFYDLTVSFQIKDSTGKTIIDAQDYNYKSHAEPTMLNVIDTYLSVVANWTCKIDKNNTLTQVGGVKANKNNADYWGYVNGAIDLSKEQILDDLDDGMKMSDVIVEDGGKFTIMLILGEE